MCPAALRSHAIDRALVCGQGEISKQEFRLHTKQLGLDAPTAEIDAFCARPHRMHHGC